MDSALLVVVVLVVLVSAGSAILFLHRRSQRRRSPSDRWQRGDKIGAASLVLGLVSLLVAVPGAFRQDGGTPTPTPLPVPVPATGSPSGSASPAGLTAAAVLRLQEGSDVSLFTEVLGQPGYRRPIEMADKTSRSREWGWADADRYMVRAVVSSEDQVEAFSVTTLSRQFRPGFPYFDGADQAPTLGVTTFDDFTNKTYDGVELEPDGRNTWGVAANGRWFYSEYHSLPNPFYRTFVLSYGLTGSGFDVDLDPGLEALDSFETCPDQPCLGKVTQPEVLAAARARWPVTTFTVLGDIGKVPEELEVLTYEPLDDDVEAADRS